MNKNILVLLGCFKTIPPIGMENPGIVHLIYEPLQYLCKDQIRVISLWNGALSDIEYDKTKYLHVKIDKVRLINAIPYRVKKIIFGYSETKRLSYWINMMLLLRRIKPDIVITHIDPKLANLASWVYPKAEHIFYYHGSVLEKSFNKTSWNEFSSRMSKLIVLNNAAICGLEEQFGELNISYKIINNGIDSQQMVDNDESEREQARDYFKVDKENLVVIYAGRLIESKNVHELIEGFIKAHSINQNLRLIIAGDPAKETYGDSIYFNLLRQIAQKVPENTIQFVGWLSEPNMNLLYKAGDISILPSSIEGGEGNSLFIMESMGHGLACIATNVGGNPEVLGKAGILISPHNIRNDLAIAIGKLYSNAFRKKLGNLAQERARNHFTYVRVAKELQEYIDLEI